MSQIHLERKPVIYGLPPEYEWVIVAYHHQGDPTNEGAGAGTWRSMGMWKGDGWEIFGEDPSMAPFAVIAWMHLPDPPRLAWHGLTRWADDRSSAWPNDHHKPERRGKR